jgi:prephenate dehydrogenase
MKLFNKVAIIGVGLIGGSLALAIKEKRLAKEVVGVSRHKKTLSLARRIGAIDKGSQRLSIVKGSDLLIFATPVNVMLALAPLIAKIIKPDCLVTDVGSTKEEVSSKLGKIFPGYVGSHPLAGSEKRSIINASPQILKNSLCVLTPQKNTNLKALKKIEKLWKKLGLRVIFLSAGLHDKILALLSHLPHAVAFSLIRTMPGGCLNLATNSLREMTRIAASDSLLWADIFLSNQKNILASLKLLEKNLADLKSAIKRKDRKLLTKILKQAKEKRDILDSSS